MSGFLQYQAVLRRHKNHSVMREDSNSKTYYLSKDYVTVNDAKHRHLALHTLFVSARRGFLQHSRHSHSDQSP